MHNTAYGQYMQSQLNRISLINTFKPRKNIIDHIKYLNVIFGNIKVCSEVLINIIALKNEFLCHFCLDYFTLWVQIFNVILQLFY